MRIKNNIKKYNISFNIDLEMISDLKDIGTYLNEVTSKILSYEFEIKSDSQLIDTIGFWNIDERIKN